MRTSVLGRSRMFRLGRRCHLRGLAAQGPRKGCRQALYRSLQDCWRGPFREAGYWVGGNPVHDTGPVKYTVYEYGTLPIPAPLCLVASAVQGQRPRMLVNTSDFRWELPR